MSNISGCIQAPGCEHAVRRPCGFGETEHVVAFGKGHPTLNSSRCAVAVDASVDALVSVACDAAVGGADPDGAAVDPARAINGAGGEDPQWIGDRQAMRQLTSRSIRPTWSMAWTQ
jgi:hypothetical protein